MLLHNLRGLTLNLQEMKKASSLVEAPNVDNNPSIDTSKKRFEKPQETKERNVYIMHQIV